MQTHLGRVGDLLDRLTRSFGELARSLTHVRPSVTTWVTAGALSAANWLLDALCLALAFAAVGRPIPWGAVLLAFAGSKGLSSVGITPGGLGIVEGGLEATFVAYSVPGPAAVAAVLVYRALTLIGWSASAGWSRRCWRPSAAAAPGSDVPRPIVHRSATRPRPIGNSKEIGRNRTRDGKVLHLLRGTA